jgi:hypothetical protein
MGHLMVENIKDDDKSINPAEKYTKPLVGELLKKRGQIA